MARHDVRSAETEHVVLHGRAAAGDLVRRFATFATAGPPVMAIEGEPGSGRTSLWAVGVRAAHEAGLRVLALSAVEAEAELAGAVLGDLVQALGPSCASTLRAPQREALDSVLHHEPGTSASPAVVARAVISLLTRACADVPVLLALDDLHWCDSDTQRAIAFALRRLGDAPVRLLTTAITTGPAALRRASSLEGVGDDQERGTPVLLDACGEVNRIRLAPLPPEAVHTIVAERLSVRMTRLQTERLTELTGGNPTWILALGRCATSDGDDRPLVLPDSVRDALAPRLAQLGTQGLDTLGVVAAIGRPTVGEVIAVLAADGDDDAELKARIDTLVSRGLVVSTPDALRVVHPLLGVTALDLLPPFRRMALHQRIAAADGASAETRAEHLATALLLQHDESGAPCEERLRELLAADDDAVASARDRGAIGTAARYADHACRVAVALDEDHPRRRIRAAELHLQDNNLERAQALLDGIDPMLLPTPELERFAVLAAGVARLSRSETAADRLVSAVADYRDPEHGGRPAALLTTLRMALRQAGTIDLEDVVPAAEVVDGAAVRACTTGASDAVRHLALGTTLTARLEAGDGLDEEALGERRAIETLWTPATLAESTDYIEARGALVADHPERAAVDLDRLLDRARSAGDARAVLRAAVLAGYCELRCGRPDEARRRLDTADAARYWVDRGSDEAENQRTIRGLLALTLDEPTAVPAARSTVPDVLSDATVPRPRSRADLVDLHLAGMLAVHAEDYERSVAPLMTYRDGMSALGLADPALRANVDVELAESLVRTGRLGEAWRIARDLVELGLKGNRTTTLAQGRRLRAMIALAENDLRRALTASTEAVDLQADTPEPPQLARNLMVRATALHRSGRRPAARASLEQAHELFLACGHRWGARQAERVLRRTSGTRAPGELSASERAVAELVATGTTNKAIAGRLNLSVRTVEGHMRSVLRKLEVASRTELAARAEKLGLRP